MANPLGVSDDIWESLTSEQKTVLQGVDTYDLSWLTGKHAERLGVSVPVDVQRAAIDELKKFLAIKVIFDPHPLGMPSPLIGAMWHNFILHTAEYEAFSHRFYKKLIHHVPGGGTGQQQDAWISLYKSLFGEFPILWSLDKDGREIVGYFDMLSAGSFRSEHDNDSDDGAFP